MKKFFIFSFIALFLLMGCSSVPPVDDNSQNILSNLNETIIEKKEEPSLGESWRESIAEEEKKQKENSDDFWTKQAISCAKSYLYTVSGFSRQGLIDQLVYEGFTDEQATKAVWSLNIDWKEQALITANRYMRLGGFSFNGLVDQLEYEGFSKSEAFYGASYASM